MAVFDAHRSQGATGFGGGLIKTILSATHQVSDWNAARLTAKQLSALSDRELDDIGLIRGDIERVIKR